MNVFKSILSFKDKDNVNHRFNPDLFAIIDNKPYIIEIKQLWKNSITDNNYNKFFEEKKKAIKLFAEERNYNWIWLDFNYDKNLNKFIIDFFDIKIYKDFTDSYSKLKYYWCI